MNQEESRAIRNEKKIENNAITSILTQLLDISDNVIQWDLYHVSGNHANLHV